MLRTFCLALLTLTLSIGFAGAEEVKGEFVKFADGKLTMKVGEAEKEFKVPADLKVMVKKELIPASEALGKLKAKAKPTLVITEEKGEVKKLTVSKKDKTDK